MNARFITTRVATAILVLTALLMVGASSGLITYVFVHKGQAAERLFGESTVYFSGSFNVEPLADYGSAFSVGHNAGNSLATTRQAIASGAQVIEIDVVAMHGKLIAAHRPVAYVGPLTFRGPSLEQVWDAAGDAAVIQLDLKESTSAYRNLVFAFLARHVGERTVMVTTSDATTLRLLSERQPEVLRFLSVPDATRLRTLLADPDLPAAIDGVTIRYQLVNADSVATLKALGLVVLAWTVNDLATVNQFIGWGVDGVSTDNLAIMRLLGDRVPAGSALDRLRA